MTEWFIDLYLAQHMKTVWFEIDLQIFFAYVSMYVQK